jgi:diguanylate cyclase (GGDEF)-like protein
MVAGIFQLFASTIALYQISKFTSYKIGWVFLSLGFALMIIRRLWPIYEIFDTHKYSLFDASVTSLVSLLLLAGVVKIRKLFDLMQQQEQKLEQLSKYDFLTGASSRYSFIEFASIEIERSKRLMRPLGILLIDVDNFKSINDRYGHVAGDYVLQQITDLCKKSLRQIDMFARYGGDEFLAIFPESDIHEIKKVANRVQIEVSESSFKFLNNEIKVTLSIGIGLFDPSKDISLYSLNSKELIDSLIYQADQHMYQIKELKKNDQHTINFELSLT